MIKQKNIERKIANEKRVSETWSNEQIQSDISVSSEENRQKMKLWQ